MAKTLNLGVTAWVPLSNGVLTGKYHGHGSAGESGDAGRMNSARLKEFVPEKQRTERVIAAVKSVSDELGRSMARVALAWLRNRPVPVIPIIGARKLSQLQDNLASFDLTLSADQLTTLDEASRIELGLARRQRSCSLRAVRRSSLERADRIALRLWRLVSLPGAAKLSMHPQT